MALLPDRIFNVRIKLRNDSHANWEKQSNFVPMDGEIIIYDIDNEHKFQMIKIGDGSKKLSNLPFINDFYTKEEIDAFVKQLQDNIDKEFEENLANIAYTGNVTDLIQDNDNYLIFECNPR